VRPYLFDGLGTQFAARGTALYSCVACEPLKPACKHSSRSNDPRDGFSSRLDALFSASPDCSLRLLLAALFAATLP
jgi:hypothetical protein